MASYRGRTGPNFSQYLSELNTVSPEGFTYVPEENDLSNDLAMYTNTDFTNLDIPSLADDGSFNFDIAADAPSQDGLKYEDLLSGQGPPTDFNVSGALESATPAQPHSFYTSYNTPIQPAPAPAPSSGFPTIEQSPQGGAQRDDRRSRAGTVQSVEHISNEEKSRLAAEEDKRRRNTAASARFRVKKKQREQALEKSLKETQDKNSKLEARISHLEMENKWLKDLITEKNGISSKEEIAAAFEQHRKESEERDLKSEPTHTSGVGTD